MEMRVTKRLCNDKFSIEGINDEVKKKCEAAFSYFKDNFDAFVFEGGGIRGIAFGGTIDYLDEHKLREGVNKFSGSSAGSIVAAACAIDLKGVQIIDILNNTDFNQFKDDSYFFIPDILRFWRKFGIFKGEKFKEWFTDIVVKHCENNITFKEVYERYGNELVITGTCLNTGTTCYFHKDDFPNMPISEAVRISMSIPVFFASVRITEQDYVKWMPKITQQDIDNYVGERIQELVDEIKDPKDTLNATHLKELNERIEVYHKYLRKELKEDKLDEMVLSIKKKITIERIKKAEKTGKIGIFVDGGMLNNYPIWVFDGKKIGDPNITDSEIANSKTFGFKLMTDNDETDYSLYQKDVDIDALSDFFKCLLNSMSYQIERGYIRTGYWKRTTQINTHNVSWLEFNLPLDTKEKLIQQGYDAIHKKIEEIQNEEYK